MEPEEWNERCLAVVVPCFDEEATIVELLRRVLQSPLVAEVVVVDDHSTDGTAAQLATVHDPRVRVLRQPVNLGKGAALRRGFREVSAPYTIVQDADLEYDPAEYAQVIEPLVNGQADVVFGSRFLGCRPHRVLYYWHSVGNRFLTAASNMFTNLNLTDMETCYKAFRREVLESIEIEEDRFGFEPEITAKVAKGGWRVYEVGISYAGRTYAEGKKIGWRDGMRAMYGVLRYSRAADAIDRHVVDRPAPDAPFDDADAELAEALDSLGRAPNYAEWIVSLCEPHLGRDVLEIGGGHGEVTERVLAGRTITVTDVSKRCVERLQARFEGEPGVTVLHGDLDVVEDRDRFDSVLVVNVLEHIADDVEVLRELRDRLRPGGRLLVFAPAFEGLYSEFDRRIGHRRRYRIGQLVERVDRAGLHVVDAHYVGAVGAMLWWGYARQLRRLPTQPTMVDLYDRMLVPAQRKAESLRRPRFGQSVFLVAERPAR